MTDTASTGSTARPAALVERPPALTPVLDLSVDCDPPVDVGPVAGGFRRIIPITGGSFVGIGEHAIKGEILPGGADWNLQRDDGSFEVWAHYVLRTDDGATITITNSGIITVGPDGLRARTIPSFEVADDRYRWLARSVFVGHLEPRSEFTGVELRLYQVD
jgi:hypothetical protein